MTRTQNDTGRAYEYAVVDYFSGKGYKLGPLATEHSSQYEAYFLSQTASTRKEFQDSSETFFKWFDLKFGKKVSKKIEALTDNSGSVVDVFIGDPGYEVNFSLKHNHLALRHNRPHGIPERCGIKGTKLATEYLEGVYKIEKNLRIVDPAKRFSDLKNKRRWMKEINDHCKKHLEIWQIAVPETVPNYFGFLTGNDRPYYKLVLNSAGRSSGTYIHEFLTSSLPKKLALSYVSNDHLQLKFDNGWTIKKRLHNASSKLGSLDMTNYSQTTDWKWDVSLVTRPDPVEYKI
jgi:hypothetical protein